MLKNLYIVGGLLLVQGVSAQVLTNQPTQPNINNSNAFLDASTNYATTANDGRIGKGLIFPDVDLTQFAFDLSYADGQTFPTYFDGMLVYNTGKGKTGNDADTQGVSVDVEPGFYYFYNPEGATNQNISNGKWVRIGGGASTSVAGANVATGTFTHNGGNKSVLGNNVPTDLKAITSIKIARIDDNGALSLIHI